jgi:DNA repair exonuclease SbcCD ATPase subunit
MSQFKLRKIYLKNWMTVREQEIEFPSHGLVFVSGVDESSQFESIGSGKTSLGEALSMAVCGIRGRYASLGHYSTNEKGNTLVKVEGSFGGKDLAIEMGYKYKELSKTGEGLRFTLDGSAIARSHVNLTRNELGQTLGITPEVAMWSVYVDGDQLDFSSLSQTEAVELMMSALGQPSWSSYYDKAKKTLTELKSDVAAKSSSKETLLELIDTTKQSIIKASEVLDRENLAFESQKETMAQQLAETQQKLGVIQDQIKERANKRKDIKAKIKKVEDELAEQNKALEIVEMRLRNEKAAISQEKKPLSQLENQISSEHYRSDLDLKSLKLKPKECPTCKKPWDKGPSDSDIEKATNKVTQVLEKLSGIRAQIDEITTREDAKQDEIDEHQKKQRQLNVKDQVRGFSTELDTLDRLDAKAATECTALTVQVALLSKGPSNSGVVKAQGVLDSKQVSLVEYEGKLTSVQSELEENQQLCKVVEYWSGAFNSSGIPNMVLSRSVDPLNQVSMALSHRMSGGTLGITYETTRELTNGADKNCLNIRVKNSRGASRVAGNSKGESGLTNLIVAETITEVGRVSSRIGFRWYDEVVNSQDPKVRKCILAYLKETAQRLGILIFVVDHHPEVSAYADHVLRATKSKEGVTTFSWV